jgi:hypothetical protein
MSHFFNGPDRNRKERKAEIVKDCRMSTGPLLQLTKTRIQDRSYSILVSYEYGGANRAAVTEDGMRAIENADNADVIKLVEEPIHQVRPHDLLVRVRAARHPVAGPSR